MSGMPWRCATLTWVMVHRRLGGTTCRPASIRKAGCAHVERAQLTDIGRRGHLNRLAAAIAMMLASPGHADDLSVPASGAGPPEVLEEVTVYARRLVPVTRVAATVTVISRRRAAAQPGR